MTWPRLTASPSAVTGSRISGHHGGVSTARALTRAGVCFAAVGLLAADARYYGALARHEKRWMDNLADRPRPAAGAARLITSMGATRHAIPLAAGASVFRSLFDGNRHGLSGGGLLRGQGIAPVFTIVSGAVARHLLCEVSARSRPPSRGWHVRPEGHSFPSRHTTVAALTAGVLAPSHPVAASAIAASLVGATRLYLGVHWPTDVLAAWLFAIGWLALAEAVTDQSTSSSGPRQDGRRRRSA